MEKTFEASNIKCAGCVANIQQALGKLNGIDQVDVDIPTGAVTVHGNEIDDQLVIHSLADAGYPIKS